MTSMPRNRRALPASGVLAGCAAILAATRVPRAVPRCGSLAVAGTWSRFLSLLVVGLPHVRRRDDDRAGERSNS